MPHETNLFSAVNRDFRVLMKATEKNPNVLQACSRISKSIGTCCHRLFTGSYIIAIVGQETFRFLDSFADEANGWVNRSKC